MVLPLALHSSCWLVASGFWLLDFSCMGFVGVWSPRLCCSLGSVSLLDALIGLWLC
jgi:hypothetical protein